MARRRSGRARLGCRMATLAGAVAAVGLAPAAAHAGFNGVLEAPAGIVGGVSNVQGWVYTTTPGAHLIQPFDVLVDGVKVMEVPCCSDRGDVQDAFPEAPLRTGFSGVFNWSLVVPEGGSLAADVPQGGPPPPQQADVIVQVLVTDDQGGGTVLSSMVTAVQAGFEFNKTVSWSLPSPLTEDGLELVAGGATVTDCLLGNSSVLSPGGAEMACSNLVFGATDGAVQICSGLVFFSWDRASQSFKLTSGCVPPKL